MQTRSVDDVAASLDGGYLLMSGFLVFVMQAGFAMLCAGSVRTKNTMNILLKNVLDACAASVAFYVLGYGFAYGTCKHNNGFIGCGLFALHSVFSESSWQSFLFQWAFSAASATIVSGSVAERTSLMSYFLYSILLTGFVYPVIVHWIWSPHGWLSAFNPNALGGIGMIDFAGSGVVHMVGGVAGLMGAIVVGPRTGRFENGKTVAMPGHSATLVVLGTFLLWFGWYGFNPGSMLAISTPTALTVTARVSVTTTLAAGAGGMAGLFATYFMQGHWDLMACCNGLLCGLVAITAGCSTVEPWAAILIGGTSALVFIGACLLLEKLQIDDPLSAAPMHGAAGAWGVFCVGLLAKRQYVMEAYGTSGAKATYGAFYGGTGHLLGCQVLGIVVITAWVGGIMFALFFTLHMLGLLRVKPEVELAGLDVSKHGGSAYNTENTPDAFKKGPTVQPEY